MAVVLEDIKNPPPLHVKIKLLVGYHGTSFEDVFCGRCIKKKNLLLKSCCYNSTSYTTEQRSNGDVSVSVL